MLLKTLVKVSAVNNLSDARYCASMGVQLIGLPLDHNHMQPISPAKFKEITQWIHGVKLVGEMQHSDLTAIQETLHHYQVDYLQLDHPVDLSVIASLDIPILIRVILQGPESLEDITLCLRQYEATVNYFIIETIVHDEAIIDQLQKHVEQLALNFPILQGFDIQPENLNYLLEETNIQGIALQGGIEIKPGYKDFEHLSMLLSPLIEE
jgi:phosphoribosylanthranilate isomerase